MAKGRKTGGRQKGTPNKVTTVAREAFLATFERLTPDLETWLQQTANGWDEEVTMKPPGGGEPITVIKRVGKDPGKAADLLIRMAEYHVPKLNRSEVVGEGGGALVVKVVTYAEPKPDA